MMHRQSAQYREHHFQQPASYDGADFVLKVGENDPLLAALHRHHKIDDLDIVCPVDDLSRQLREK
jgi:hypothetical protein